MAASDVNNYFMGLVTGSSKGTLPELYGEINNSHGIKRISRIREQDYLDDLYNLPVLLHVLRLIYYLHLMLDYIS